MKNHKNLTINKYIHWKVLESNDVFIAKQDRFKISVQRIKLPDGKIIDDYYRIQMPESVVIVARTNKNKIVMCKQYRHGFARVSMVLPAGMIESGEKPIQTAKRELLEETGYASEKWKNLGRLISHINYGCSKVNFFFADNAKQIKKPESGDLEEMEIILMTEKEIVNAVKKKDIISMGTITALTLVKIELC
ncbi:MAG: NUDIX hydrolase [Elusimicrobiota bacterium]